MRPGATSRGTSPARTSSLPSVHSLIHTHTDTHTLLAGIMLTLKREEYMHSGNQDMELLSPLLSSDGDEC